MMVRFLYLPLLFLPWMLAAAEPPPRVTSDSLQSLLTKALEAFSANDFPTAATLFQQLERDFGAEETYQEPDFLRRMLPLKGHAELAAGLPTAAAATLSRFVESYPHDEAHPAALFALATALSRDSRPNEALARLITFSKRYATRPEAPLAQLQQAELLLALNQQAAAFELLHTLFNSDAPPVVRQQARLRIARRSLDADDLSTATQFLLEHHWRTESTAEIATVAFTALDLGDRLMAANLPADAVRAYRLVPPRPRLLELQQAQIERIQQKIHPAPATDSQRFWNDYYRRLATRLTDQLASLRDAADYSSALLLRRGQALLLVERHHEAWLLFEQLALDERLPDSMREEAHYRWILAASGLKSWEEALTIARNFLVRYPDAPLAPQSIYLIARAHQEQRRYTEAAAILAELSDNFPDHPLAQRWRFTLGFNHALLEDFPTARTHFRRAAEEFPETPLTANAELWHALTFFFARDYETALTELTALADRYPQHTLTGEILYRRASTLYAMRRYNEAETATAAFAKRFQGHPRHPEALVLLGDIRMGAGKLDRALTAFQAIDPDAGATYLYSLFQQGKILRAQEAFPKVVTLFSNYVERADLKEKPRLSEALYWIGWAHTQLGQKEKAAPVFQTALKDHGNDPTAVGIGSVLDVLARLYPLPDAPDETFADWIEAERQRALESEQLTYFSRLTLHLAQTKRRNHFENQADNLLFEIADLVPPEQLGADALGQVGHMMVQKDLQSAEPLFDRLLKTYPSASECAFAYHGLAKRHRSRGDFEEALSWLRRFEKETPTHPLAPQALQMHGEILLALKRLDEASQKFNEILRLRSMRGRPHAAALIGLAQTAVAANEPKKAVAYYQRVYTMHLAQNDLAAEAYFESSRLFEELDDLPTAHRTLTEMLSLPDLQSSPYFSKARAREAELAPKVAAIFSVAPKKEAHVQ